MWLVAALERPTDVPGLAARLAELSEAERTALRRGGASLGRGARARLAYLLARLGAKPDTRSPRSAGQPVLLDPARPSGGPTWCGVVVNAADGLPIVEDALGEAFETWLNRQLGAAWRLVASALAAGGRPTYRALATACGEGGARCLEGLVARGLVVDEPAGLRLVAPMQDLARAGASRVRPNDSVALAGRLREGSGPDVHAAVLLLTAAGKLDAARALASDRRLLLLAELDVQRLGTLATALAPPGTVEGVVDPRLLFPLLDATGRVVELAELAAAERARARGPERAHATVWAARAAWRTGRSAEAKHLVERLPRGAPDETRLEAELLVSLLEQEAGAWSRAERALGRALALADASGSAGAVARCRHRQGTLASRRGQAERAAGAYLAALDALGQDPHPDLRLQGVLVSNLATMRLWAGRLDDAERLYRDAVRIRSRAGSPRDVVATRVAAARVERARLGRSDAVVTLSLARQAQALSDPALAAEAWLDAAEAAELGGDHAGALSCIDRARAAEAALTGEDRILGLLVDAVSARVLSRETGATRTTAALDRAADELSGMGVPFYAARVRRLAAGAALPLDQAGALARLATAHALADRAGLVLCEERAFIRLYSCAALSLDGRLAALGLEALDKCPPADVRRVLGTIGGARAADLVAKLASLRAAEPSSGRVALRTSRGPRTCDGDEADALRRGLAGHLVFDEDRAELVAPDGTRESTLRRPRLGELLLSLAAGRGEPVTVADLARAVWRVRDTPGARAAVKVAVGRARRTVRPHGADIAPVRRGGAPAYRWDGELEVVLIGAPRPT